MSKKDFSKMINVRICDFPSQYFAENRILDMSRSELVQNGFEYNYAKNVFYKPFSTHFKKEPNHGELFHYGMFTIGLNDFPTMVSVVYDKNINGMVIEVGDIDDDDGSLSGGDDMKVNTDCMPGYHIFFGSDEDKKRR